jgi:flagellar basal body-associated protein FliL
MIVIILVVVVLIILGVVIGIIVYMRYRKMRVPSDAVYTSNESIKTGETSFLESDNDIK